MKKQRKLKNLLAVAVVAGAVAAAGTAPVCAAGLRDIFDADYYAGRYGDLQVVIGNNKEKLFSHFLQYGLKEGRCMSPVLDVVKYRQTYEDLNAAFGDNWDAYVQHYITRGIQEKRISGGTFDPVAYAALYRDVREAYGEDYAAIIAHYLTHGIREGRASGVQKAAAEEQKPSQETPGQTQESPSPAMQAIALPEEQKEKNALVRQAADGDIAGVRLNGKQAYASQFGQLEIDEDGKVAGTVKKVSQVSCLGTEGELEGYYAVINLNTYREAQGKTVTCQGAKEKTQDADTWLLSLGDDPEAFGTKRFAFTFEDDAGDQTVTLTFDGVTAES